MDKKIEPRDKEGGLPSFPDLLGPWACRPGGSGSRGSKRTPGMFFGLPGPRAGRPGVQGSPGGSGVSSVGFPFFSSTICRWSNPKSFQKLIFGCSSDSSRGFEARDPKHHLQNILFSTSAGLGIIKGLSNPAKNQTPHQERSHVQPRRLESKV